MLFDATRAAELDYCGLVSGADHDKFRDLHWHCVPSAHVDAPYATEAACVYECRLKEHHDLGAHTSFVGEIVNVLVRSDCLSPDTGMPDLHAMRPVMYDCMSSQYFVPGPFCGHAFQIGRK
jgi:flavin reductase (DIM6/NTAB) family NADH-FMN oxidoreductase RutF